MMLGFFLLCLVLADAGLMAVIFDRIEAREPIGRDAFGAWTIVTMLIVLLGLR